MDDHIAFLGWYRQCMDEKRRIVLPADFRETLSARIASPDNRRVVLTRLASDGMPYIGIADLLHQGSMLANASGRPYECAYAAQGRLVLPEPLAKHAGVAKGASYVIEASPDRTHLRLWNERTWQTWGQRQDTLDKKMLLLSPFATTAVRESPSTNQTIDDKRRVTLPAAFGNGPVYFAFARMRSFPCIELTDEAHFASVRDRVESNKAYRGQMESWNRAVIPEPLADHAGLLPGQPVVLEHGTHCIRLWNPSTYDVWASVRQYVCESEPQP
jgi:DNA-binding transcriptional regulator/RsmH inhibitor MraZ